LTVGTVVALAGLDSTMVLMPPTETTVVPVGIPVVPPPVTVFPAASPVRLLNAVTVVVPLVRKPVGVTEEVPVVVVEAVVDMVIVSPMGSKLDTVVPAGIPVPVIGSPVRIPLTLDTCVMIAVPLVTKPVGATELVAEATAPPMRTVPAAAVIPAWAMKLLEGRFVPERICPGISPAVGVT